MFKYNEFRKEYVDSDLCALEYLEKTLIKEYKEKRDPKSDKFTKEEYIVSLFYATKELNNCDFIGCYTGEVENNFKRELYTNVRDKLFEEIGFNLEELYNDANNIPIIYNAYFFINVKDKEEYNNYLSNINNGKKDGFITIGQHNFKNGTTIYVDLCSGPENYYLQYEIVDKWNNVVESDVFDNIENFKVVVGNDIFNFNFVEYKEM